MIKQLKTLQYTSLNCTFSDFYINSSAGVVIHIELLVLALILNAVVLDLSRV